MINKIKKLKTLINRRGFSLKKPSHWLRLSLIGIRFICRYGVKSHTVIRDKFLESEKLSHDKYDNNVSALISENNDKLVAAYSQYIEQIFSIRNKSDKFIEYKENNIIFADDDVKPIACYLTQFHAIPENDKWWGKGFTEWTNVTKAMPLYSGHYQPHLPLETFYDLSNVNVMKRQVELAKNYGIYGFCFHYYWFSGKRLLEKPLENFLNTIEDLDFPFCINWANHHWTRIWDASENEVLMSQDHSEDDDLACITDICRFLRDDRYIKVNGKPLVSIYNPSLLPNPNKTIDIWRKYCRENGIGEIHLVGMDYNLWNPLIYNFDGAIAQSPHDINGLYAPQLNRKSNSIYSNGVCNIFDMEKYVNEKIYFLDKREGLYRGIIPNFDNTARRCDYVHILQLSPEFYSKWLYDIIKFTKENFERGNRFIFINAWNEWAEGAHLEPDRKYGYAYLQATADTIRKFKSKNE